MTIQTWLLFGVTVLTLIGSPGPMTLLAMSHGLRYGWKRSFASALGGMSSTLALMGLSAAGLGLILAASELAFQIIKWGGAAYLIYVGIKTWGSSQSKDQSFSQSLELAKDPSQNSAKLFTEMFYVGLSNPNALLFFSALFPQFINQAKPLIPQLALLAITFTILEFSFLMIYAYGAGRIGRWLKNSGKLQWFNRVAGGLFIGAGVVLANVKR